METELGPELTNLWQSLVEPRSSHSDGVNDRAVEQTGPIGQHDPWEYNLYDGGDGGFTTDFGDGFGEVGHYDDVGFQPCCIHRAFSV